MKTDDILDPVENISISINFIQAYHLLKNGLRFKICFNSMIQKEILWSMMRELLNINKKRQLMGTVRIQNIETKC